MNLIEKLGLEKCQAIVHGAPGWAVFWITRNEYHISMLSFPNMTDQQSYLIADLRTAIADHEKCQHEWNETTSNGDAYRFFVCKHCDSTQNYVPFEADNCSDIRNHVSPNTKVIEHE